MRHSVFSRERRGRRLSCYPGDPRKDMPHRPLVGFGAHARRDVARDHELVAKLPRLPRGRLDPDMGGDAAKDDRAYAAALELGIEVGHEKRAPGRLGDQNIVGLGEARREVGETRRQDPRAAPWARRPAAPARQVSARRSPAPRAPERREIFPPTPCPARPVRRRRSEQVSCRESRFAGRSARARSFVGSSAIIGGAPTRLKDAGCARMIYEEYS